MERRVSGDDDTALAIVCHAPGSARGIIGKLPLQVVGPTKRPSGRVEAGEKSVVLGYHDRTGHEVQDEGHVRNRPGPDGNLVPEISIKVSLAKGAVALSDVVMCPLPLANEPIQRSTPFPLPINTPSPPTLR